MYASAISRQRVRINLMITTLNDVEVMSANTLNVYVQAPVTCKVWAILGHILSSDVVKIAVIVRAFYSLKSVGVSFISYVARCMVCMGWLPCWTDPDLWMRHETGPDDRVQFYLCCAMSIILDIFTTMQKVYSNTHISLSHLSWSMANQTCILLQTCIIPHCIMKYGHGWWVLLNMSMRQLKTKWPVADIECLKEHEIPLQWDKIQRFQS